MTHLALLVSTRDREASLARLLASADALEGLEGPAEPGFELVVIDNGSRDGTAARVQERAAARPWLTLRSVPEPGKSRALNDAIHALDVPWFAFTDDDVELDPGWLRAARAFVARDAYAAGQGTIRARPDPADGDPGETLRRLEAFDTIYRIDLGPDVRETRSLIGANMLIRRSLFARIGLFDERLGPGAAGACEDTELARRILAAGERIGYVPDCIVHHGVDPERLTPAYFRALHERVGRSRVYYKPAGLLPSLLPNLAWSGARVLATSATTALGGGERARLRALGRWHHYRAMLAARNADRLPGGVPPLA